MTVLIMILVLILVRSSWLWHVSWISRVIIRIVTEISWHRIIWLKEAAVSCLVTIYCVLGVLGSTTSQKGTDISLNSWSTTQSVLCWAWCPCWNSLMLILIKLIACRATRCIMLLLEIIWHLNLLNFLSLILIIAVDHQIARFTEHLSWWDI